MSLRSLYLDHASTTPCRAEVLEAMLPHFGELAGNPASLHSVGRRARTALEDARGRVAAALGASAGEIVFTGSATESIDLALHGAAEASRVEGRHIVTSAAEHHAVLSTCQSLAQQGFEITVLPVDADGRVTVAQVSDAIRADTVLCSIMHANNEIGTITPLADIVQAIRARNPRCLVHTDATASAGHIPLDLGCLPVDLVSLGAHKFHGPQGIGALYVRRGVPLRPRVRGGDQEKGLRAGTPAVPLAVGMAVALELSCQEMEAETRHWIPVRDALLRELQARIPECRTTGHPIDRLPAHASLAFLGISGEDLVLRLDGMGVSTSTGSACTTGSVNPSHVLLACGLPRAWALGGLRLTMGRGSRHLDPVVLATSVATLVTQLRSMCGVAGRRPRRPRAWLPGDPPLRNPHHADR